MAGWSPCQTARGSQGLGACFVRRCGIRRPLRRAAVSPLSAQCASMRSQRRGRNRWGGNGPHRRHWGTIYPDDLNGLADLEADLLVTHEAPGYHPHGFEILDTLAQSLGVRASVHGHQHDRLDSSAKWESQGFRSYGVGLRGLSTLDRDGNLVVIRSGELDEARAGRMD